MERSTRWGPRLSCGPGIPGRNGRAFSGCALLPGLMNSHTHLDYSAFRGFAQPCGFGDWMLRLLLARRKLDLDDYEMSALWGAYECARSGVTSIADTSYGGWTVARAARAAGLRARVYLEVFGLDDAELPATMARLEAGLGSARDGRRWRPASASKRGPLASRPLHRVGPPLSGGGALRAPRRPPSGHTRGRVGGRGGVADARYGCHRPGL